MKTIATVTLLAATLSAIAPAIAAGKDKPLPLVSAPTAALKWQEVPNSGGIRYANVRGDIFGKGPYDAFVLFPAGKHNDFHSHSANLPTVVLKGTFYADIDGKRTRFPAGSFYNLPASLPHESGCEKGEDCLLFQYQSNNFDIVPETRKP